MTMLHRSSAIPHTLSLIMVAMVSGRTLSQLPAQPAQVPAMDLPVTERGVASAAAPPASPAAKYPSFEAALAAANSTATNDLRTLLEALKVAGTAAALNSSTAWTILAPTSKVFDDRLGRDLNMTSEGLLSNKTLLLEVLSYHVIPSAAISSSNLKEGQKLPTALAGAAPLVVKFDRTRKDGAPRATPQIEFHGETNTAEVKVPDILVGSSVVYMVNDVLLPKSVCPGC